MEGLGQTSFIPKKPITSETYDSGRSVSIVTVITVIVFFGSVALALGSYFYQSFLVKQLDSKKETLDKAKAGFDLDTIKDLKRLDTRIQSAKLLLDQHTAISTFFTVLEQSTLKTVQFSNFSITNDSASAVGGASVGSNPLASTQASMIKFKMSGKAQSYNSVAIQADLFSKTVGIKEPIFSNLNLDDKGSVNFDVAGFIDPQIINYRKTVGGGSTSASQSTSGTETTSVVNDEKTTQ